MIIMKGILKLIGTTTVLVSICISRVHSEIDNGDHQVGPRTASELLSKVIPQQELLDEDEIRNERGLGLLGLTKSALGMGMGTMFSGANAMGQTMNNYAGDDSIFGKMGKMVTQVAENYAGKVKFILFNQNNPKVGYELTIENFDKSPFIKGNPILVIIHGFTPAGYNENAIDNLISSFKVKDGALKAGLKHNILLIDWSGLSSDGAYVFSSTSTATTADRISDILVWLVKQGHVSGPKEIRIIGHSLGGHTAGITGKKFKQKYGEKIARVDAIDPAGPNFDHSLSSFQLTQYDADFVHAMHCNIRLFGSALNRGKIDFYPNGGDDLPGCSNATEAGKSKRSLSSMQEDLQKSIEASVCNHVHCIDLYIETFEDVKTGCSCDNWKQFLENRCKPQCDEQKDKPRMGYYCPENVHGTYYLNVTMRTEVTAPGADAGKYNNYGAGGEEKNPGAKLAKPASLLDSVAELKKGKDAAMKSIADGPMEATTASPEREAAEIAAVAANATKT